MFEWELDRPRLNCGGEAICGNILNTPKNKEIEKLYDEIKENKYNITHSLEKDKNISIDNIKKCYLKLSRIDRINTVNYLKQAGDYMYIIQNWISAYNYFIELKLNFIEKKEIYNPSIDFILKYMIDDKFIKEIYDKLYICKRKIIDDEEYIKIQSKKYETALNLIKQEKERKLKLKNTTMS